MCSACCVPAELLTPPPTRSTNESASAVPSFTLIATNLCRCQVLELCKGKGNKMHEQEHYAQSAKAALKSIATAVNAATYFSN